MAAHSEAIAVNDEGIILRTSAAEADARDAAPTTTVRLRLHGGGAGALDVPEQRRGLPGPALRHPAAGAAHRDERPARRRRGRARAPCRASSSSASWTRRTRPTSPSARPTGGPSRRTGGSCKYVEATSFRGAEAAPAPPPRHGRARPPDRQRRPAQRADQVRRGAQSPLSCVPRPQVIVFVVSSHLLCSRPRLDGVGGHPRALGSAGSSRLAGRHRRDRARSLHNEVCTQKGAYAPQAARNVWMIAGM